MISSTRNHARRAAALGLTGCLLLLGAGCQTTHRSDPMATLLRETAPSKETVRTASLEPATVTLPRTTESSTVSAPPAKTAPAVHATYSRAAEPKQERGLLKFMGV